MPYLARPTLTSSLSVCLLLLGALPAVLAQAPAPAQGPTRALSIRYPDGKGMTPTLRPSGWVWTPAIERIPGADTTRDGLEVANLHVAYQLEGPDVLVTVSLVYRNAGGPKVKVATVRVKPDTPVRVDEMKSYGVEPVTLSIESIAPAKAYAPEGISVSSQLDVRVEPVTENVATYRVVLTSRSSRSVDAAHFRGYQGDRMAISGLKRGPQNQPLIGPTSEYQFEFSMGAGRAGDGSAAWRPIDRVEVDCVVWDDGLIEGRAEDVRLLPGIDAARARRIDTLLPILRAARETAIPDLRSQVSATLNTEEVEIQRNRDAILADLDLFERAHTSRRGQNFSTWLAEVIQSFEAWRKRLPAAR
jgi:hypothetical protein